MKKLVQTPRTIAYSLSYGGKKKIKKNLIQLNYKNIALQFLLSGIWFVWLMLTFARFGPSFVKNQHGS